MAAAPERLAIARHLGSGRISAVLPAGRGADGRRLQLLDANGKAIGEPVSAMVSAIGGFARMRARLDPQLAPGSYTAELIGEVGNEQIEVVIDPVVSLRIDPPALKLEGALGARLTTTIMVANLGNVPAELPAVGAFGVFPRSGVEDAIGRAYRSDAEDGLQMFGRFVEGLRQNYGGMMRVKLLATEATPPGEARAVELGIDLPDGLEPGRRYSGIWPLMNLNYSVQVSVTGKQSPRSKGAAA